VPKHVVGAAMSFLGRKRDKLLKAVTSLRF
jgi:hypothetical protein